MENQCDGRQESSKPPQLERDPTGLDVDELQQEDHQEQQRLGIEQAVEGAPEDYASKRRPTAVAHHPRMPA